MKERPRKTITFKSSVTNKEYKIDKLITCQSSHVTYLLAGPCGHQYAGRTTRQLCVRIWEHLNNIRKGYKNHSLSQHFRMQHNWDPSMLQVCGIDKIDPHWEGINMTREVFRNETRWIHDLGTLSPAGLNIDIDINSFISIFKV